MESHGLELLGPIRSADHIDAIEIESGTGKVIIHNGLNLDFSTPPTSAYDKVLESGISGYGTWQTRSVPRNTRMLFMMASPPTGWTKDNTFVDKSMLIYKDVSFSSGGTDLSYSWTTEVNSNNTGSSHTHDYYFQTNPDTATTVRDANTQNDNLARTGHYHFLSGTAVDTGSPHEHNITNSTFNPKYQCVIAATKD